MLKRRLHSAFGLSGSLTSRYGSENRLVSLTAWRIALLRYANRGARKAPLPYRLKALLRGGRRFRSRRLFEVGPGLLVHDAHR
jgi:hypothetical protein